MNFSMHGFHSLSFQAHDYYDSTLHAMGHEGDRMPWAMKVTTLCAWDMVTACVHGPWKQLVCHGAPTFSGTSHGGIHLFGPNLHMGTETIERELDLL